MDRRQFLASTGVAALMLSRAPVMAQTKTPDAAANAAFDEIFNAFLDSSPEMVTSFGLDKGPRAAAKAKLDDNSAAGQRADGAR